MLLCNTTSSFRHPTPDAAAVAEAWLVLSPGNAVDGHDFSCSASQGTTPGPPMQAVMAAHAMHAACTVTRHR